MPNKIALPAGLIRQPNGAILLQNVRGGWPKVFTPVPFSEGGEPKYQMTALLDKKADAARIEWLQAEIASVAEEAKLGRLPPDRVCLRDGEYNSDDAVRQFWMLGASEKTRPIVMDQGKVHMTPDQADRIKGGYFYNMVVSFWSQNHAQYGKRVNANLRAVQLVKPADIIANGGSSEQLAKEAADAFSVINPDDVDLGMD